MAVQAVFQADFSNFEKGVAGAEAGLDRLKGTSRSAETSLQGMTAAASSGIGPAQSIGNAYRQFDGVLSASGLHIGGYVKGLEDLASAAEGTAGSLTKLGSAGLLVSAGIASYQLTSTVLAWTGWDKAIAQATTDILGMSTANQTFFAQQDTINRALDMGAKAGISYGDAIKYIQTESARLALARTDWVGNLAAAQREVRNLTEAQIRSITVDKEAGATVEAITAKYGLSAQAQAVLAERLKVTAEQHENATAAAKRHAEEEARVAEVQAKQQRDYNNWLGLRKMEDDAAKLAAETKAKEQHTVNLLQEAYGELAKKQAAAKTEAAGLAAQEAELERDYQATIQTVKDTGTAHTEAGAAGVIATTAVAAGYAGVAQQAQLTMDSARALAFVMRESAAANAILMENSLFTTAGQLERIAKLPLPTGFGTMNNTFNLTDTESNLARRVASTIMQGVRSGTQLT